MPKRFDACLIAVSLLIAPWPAAADCPPATQARSAEDIARRIDHYWSNPRAPETYRAQAGMGDPAVEAYDQNSRYWNAEGPRRALIVRMLPDQQNSDDQYFYAQAGNCRIDYALDTAEARVARLGANHPYVAQWLRVQRAVFSACRNEGWSASRNPTPAATTLPPAMATSDAAIAQLQRDDRAYQAASLLFYRHAPGAVAAFRAIAASNSPHAHIARYMQLAFAAQGIGATDLEPSEASEAERTARARAALAEARAILADPRLRDIHPLTQGMIGYLGYWTGDAAVRAAQIDSTLDALEAPAARIAADPVARDRYSRAASDVAWLRRSVPRDGWSGEDEGLAPSGSSVVRALAGRASRDPLAAWLLTNQSRFEREPWTLTRYPAGTAGYWLGQRDNQQAGPGRIWDVVRAANASDYDPATWTALDTLVRDTGACPTDDKLATAPSLFYHQVRAALMYPVMDENMEPVRHQDGFSAALERVRAWPWRDSAYYRTLTADMLRYLVARGRIDDARTLREQVDLRGGEQPGNATALFLLAENEDQLIREIVARPDGAQRFLNLLPVPVLTRLAGREDLPQPVRARFARTAWSRFYALQRPIPRPLDTLMRRLNPEITGSWASRPGARPDDRPLLLDVLRSPGLNIVITEHQRGGDSMGYADAPTLTSIDTFEHSDNNWWCAWQVDRHRITASAIMYGAFFRPEEDWSAMAAAGASSALGPLLRASWLWRAQDNGEQEALSGIESAPHMLAERAIAWRGRGNGDGQDEALALAIRATRYGCQRQGGHGEYSHAAWDLLHSRFPDSDAARRTRWWFDCSHFSGGCATRRPDDEPDWERWAGWGYGY